MLLFLQMDPTNSHGFLFRRFDLSGPPTFKLEMKQQKPQEEEIPVQAMAALKISKNTALDVIDLMISLLGDR